MKSLFSDESQGCPGQEAWAAFNVGKVSAAEANRLTDHLSQCSRCVAALQSMGDSADALVMALQKAPAIDGLECEGACLRAEAAAAALGTTGSRLACSATPPWEKALPQQIREYHLVERLGQGGMGTVYKALHGKLKRPVALKILNLHQGAASIQVARFQREMEAIGKLDHPNIVRATDAGEENGLHFLVMELVDGVDLGRLVERFGPLPLADACELIRQAALGLQHAHQHGLIHRDIKPSNLILAGACCVKILDLGLALLGQVPGFNSQLTDTGLILGTTDYMAPEQARNTHTVDGRADLYSLGCTLYQLLTGQAPFADRGTALEKVMAHAMDAVPSLGQKRPEAPQELLTMVERLLAKNPADRYATAGEVADALAPFTTGCALAGLLNQSGPIAAVLSVPTLIAPTVVKTTTRRRFPWLVGVILFLALLAGTLFYFPWPGSHDEQKAKPPPPDPTWLALLAHVEPNKDAVAGQWTRQEGGLVSEAIPFARLELPYQPPPEYDFHVEFTSWPAQPAPQGQGEVFQVFTIAGLQARWAMWCLDFEHHGFIWDQSAFAADNPTLSRAARRLEPGRKYTSLLEVRTDGVQAYLDGKAVSHWQANFAALPNDLAQTRLKNRDRLGLGSYESRILFHAAKVRAVTGQGKLVR